MNDAPPGGAPARPVRVREPVTLITDWILAVAAACWAVALLSAGADRGGAGSATLIWGSAFAAAALASAIGGAVHGFQHRMPSRPAGAMWRATLHLVTVASAGMLAAAVLVHPGGPLVVAGLALVVGKLAATSLILVRRPQFRLALVDYVVTMAAVLALQAAAWMADGAASAPWIVAGIGVSTVAAAIQALRIAPHPRFNHNDLYHLVQLFALWMLYRGGLLLGAG